MRDRYASLREGLVGAWIPSISGSGLLLPDLSGQGNNGTLTNMGPEDWVSSQYGRALDFDGSNDYAVIGDVLDSFFAGASARFTVSAWTYPTVSGTLAIAGKNADGNFSENERQWILRYFNQSLDFVWHGSLAFVTIRIVRSSETIPLNTWTHVAATFDATITNADAKANLFINGNLASYTIAFSQGTPTSMQDGAAPLTIGAYSSIGGTSSNNNFFGQLDDVRIYNRALSEPEIKLLASRPGIGLRPQRRTMYYAPPTGARRRRILTSMP